VPNPLNELLDEAQHDIDTSQYEAAIAALQKFLSEKPDVAFAHFQLAYAFTALQRVDDARTEYERAMTLDPKMPEAPLNLGILLLEKDPAEAVPPLRKAVELLPAQSRPRFLLGAALQKSGDLAGAAEFFEGASRLDPRDSEALLHLANLYMKLQKPVEAERKYRGVLELQPNSAAASLGLAQSLEAQNRPEAAEAYRDYLNLQPNDAQVRGRLVHMLVAQENYDSALAELERSEAGSAPSVDGLRLRADIQIGQKKYKDAVVTLQQAIRLAPADPQLVSGLGRVYLQNRDFPSAEKQFKAALQLDRNNLAYWKDLSSTYYLSGNYPAALATLDVIAKAEPPAAGTWFIRALCYDKLRQPKPALEAYEKFLAMEAGKSNDQVWQAQERSKVLKHMLENH
jgi:Flp pilus assembly protein TadD